MSINEEKKKVLRTKGSALVTANPGTGKTLLLAHKYAKLVEQGVSPDQILCLTFTKKAKREMEDRIIHLLGEKGLKPDLSELNVHTFHSYCLEQIGEETIISTNLIRHVIYKYLKDEEVLNYSDQYLLDVIVPKIENLMRYVKNFGILPERISVERAKKHLEPEKTSREDLEAFLEHFVRVYERYEEEKEGKGCDYSDLLIKYLNMVEEPLFEHVLVDELQDVNEMEADIALKSGKTRFAVGDAKQAIFGFQGGSILNFEKFRHGKEFTLSQNFRSTDQILDYARHYFTSRTSEDRYAKDLENLRSSTGFKGDKPRIVSSGEDRVLTACNLAQQIHEAGGEVAVIARTNNQVARVGDELRNRNLDYSSTFFSASNDARTSIVKFVHSLFTKDEEVVKEAMFTPFFPITLHDAFEIAGRWGSKLSDVYEKCEEFKSLREGSRSLEDVKKLFDEVIIPVSASYGEEYFLAALTVKKSFLESMQVLDDKGVESVCEYMLSSDLAQTGSSKEEGIIVTTVHKAKGKEFENVVYLPKQVRDRTNFVDKIVEAILASQGLSVEEELEEEDLRIDFVALTRAENKLFVVTDKPGEFLNDYAVLEEPSVVETEKKEYSERKRRAFNLFVNKKFEEARTLLEGGEAWVARFVRNHFCEKSRISYSHLTMRAQEYLKNTLFKIRVASKALTMGSRIHDLAESVVLGEEVSPPEEFEDYVSNVKQMVSEIKQHYPVVVSAEHKFKIPLEALGVSSQVVFTGVIDAVFKNESGEYLIVDWKTSKRTSRASEHRRQLEVYKRCFCAAKNIPLDKVRVGIGYVGLRKRINNGEVMSELDDRQPSKTAFSTALKRVEKFLEWKRDPDLFFEGLREARKPTRLTKAILEQYDEENQ